MARTGRPRAFDSAVALQRARDLFWSAGYGDTSVQDLVDDLGVERGSLYAAYGDKRSLYLRAVQLYWTEYEASLTRALRSVPLLPALREMLILPAQLGTISTEPGNPRGCMMGNTVVELVPQDAEATALVNESFARFRTLVAEALGEAQARGEVSDSASPEVQAQLLLTLTQGTSLLSRTGADATRAIAAIDLAVDGLRPPGGQVPPASNRRVPQ
ncbi:TetR/AcrR family transcriptional regulator [Brachybacterium sp. GCM10030252]|uniref:TetR/AcrR family transcriptional regulator n=1 Tax=Brachybacterium sp. GCM10030252 TaxID=3273380 RepID=UPI00361DB6A8